MAPVELDNSPAPQPPRRRKASETPVRDAFATKKLFIVEPNALARAGLRLLFADDPGTRICGEAATPADARPLIAHTKPDLVLIGVRSGDQESLDLVRELRSGDRPTGVIVLTDDEESFGAQFLRLGAGACIDERSSCEDVLRVTREVSAGHVYLTPRIIDRLIRQRNRPATRGNE